ncbi:MAG: DUF3459 domain-containing protein [Anaerolineae bacterium]|nr:DUF3459 domain-containing protein [Anaerolineae bacterium]
MQELRALVDSYSGDRVLIGEDANFAYHGPDNDELHLVFNFPLTETKRLTPTHIRTNQAMRLGALPTDAWPCNTLGNHDSPRVFSRYGDGANNDALARLHAALLLTLWGTPFLFNGEEIGMADLELTELSQVRDTAALGQYRRLTSMRGLSANEAMQAVAITTRDRCRTPMQWDNTPNAGFSPAGVQPWLPVNPNYADGVNVADQIRDSASMLNFYKRLLHLRKQIPALIAGRFTVLHDNAEDYLTFIRSTDTQACLVVLNTSEQPQTVRFNLDLETQRATCLLSSSARDGQTCELSALQLAPFEIFIGELVK